MLFGKQSQLTDNGSSYDQYDFIYSVNIILCKILFVRHHIHISQLEKYQSIHSNDVIMSAMAYQIAGVSIICSIVCRLSSALTWGSPGQIGRQRQIFFYWTSLICFFIKQFRHRLAHNASLLKWTLNEYDYKHLVVFFLYFVAYILLSPYLISRNYNSIYKQYNRKTSTSTSIAYCSNTPAWGVEYVMMLQLINRWKITIHRLQRGLGRFCLFPWSKTSGV